MRDRSLRVLLIQDNPDSIELLQEALAEMEELRYARGWTHGFQVTLADGIEAAAGFLEESTFDAVILDCEMEDGDPLPACRRIRREFPRLPVILLCAEAMEPLAMMLIRQGAQDYLIKTDFDGTQLARALRKAVERSRLSLAEQSISLLDDLTGLYNSRGFEYLAERYSKLADRYNLQLLAVVMEMARSGTDDQDLEILRLADSLRTVFEPTDVLARTGATRFSAVALVSDPDEVVSLVRSVNTCLGSAASSAVAGFAFSAPESGEEIEALLARAGSALCENRAA